jgi:hypothetical protein
MDCIRVAKGMKALNGDGTGVQVDDLGYQYAEWFEISESLRIEMLQYVQVCCGFSPVSVAVALKR